MVFEPNFTKVVSSERNNVCTTQSVIELKLPTNDNNISKIYSVGAKSTIIRNEVSGREVSFNGVVDFQAVYESEGFSAIDYTAEFKDRFVCDKDLRGEVILTSSVIDVSSSIVSGGIRVVAIVEISIDEICSKDINILTSVSGDDVHVSNNDITYSTYLGKAYEKFDIGEDIKLDNVKNVLMVTPCVSLSKVDPRDNYIIVNGKLGLDVCYQSGDNINDISTHHFDVGFDWEVAFDGVESNSIVQSVVDIITNEIKISTTIDNGTANMNVFVPITYSGYVFKENTVMVVEDLYLEKNYISITCENFYTIECNNSISFKDNISGTASVLDTAPFIDEVLGVSTNNIVLASSRVSDSKLYIEGIVNSTVVYFTKETNEITSVQVEMPFAVEQKVEGGFASVVTMCLDNLSARSKRGKEIEVSAELNVFADVYGRRQECVVTDVVVTGEKSREECSIVIYVVKPNQTIWDVAKETNVSQELILEQNPNVELPLKTGDKLVVYKPNLMMF